MNNKIKINGYWIEKDDPDYQRKAGLRNIISCHVLDHDTPIPVRQLFRRVFGGYGEIVVTENYAGMSGGEKNDSLRGFGATEHFKHYEIYGDGGEKLGGFWYGDNGSKITDIEVISDDHEKPMSLLNKSTWSGHVAINEERYVFEYK